MIVTTKIFVDSKLQCGRMHWAYEQVIRNEVEQVKNACQKAGGKGYRPHITFVVATKMHNLRLYKQNIPRNERAPGQNVTPGTVVDQNAVSATLNEFYLTSHSAFQVSFIMF
ncbi:unnamed protein product [Anisakis simplex]|uniref:Piwi domain-containing protein n=1 Tax=Anisakis simplex TaxID=6269 RepID=A0A0M3JFL6_ANISI|nr:unnamed protein product [Anisakis simplex]